MKDIDYKKITQEDIDKGNKYSKEIEYSPLDFVKDLFEEEFKDLNISKNIDIMEKQKDKEKWNIDTVLINKIILEKAGLKTENIIDSGLCSVCNKDLIHSFRVEKQGYGLNTALIALK